MLKAFLLVMPVRKFSALLTAEAELENPVYKLAPLGHGQLFNITAPNLCEPHIPHVELFPSHFVAWQIPIHIDISSTPQRN